MAEIQGDALAKGQVLRGQRNTYTLDKLLGSGLTSNVWLAYDAEQKPVALKCLRADASEVSIENFWHEADILAELRGSGAGEYVPQLLDSARAGPVPFLALEFISQPPYQSLEKQVDKPTAIPEDELLQIVIQALDLLSLLHTKVERSYTDMQLKNFWWDATAQRLKVMDWNHVSLRRTEIDATATIADENLRRERQLQLANWGARDFQGLVQADLARFASYVYQLATSRPIAAQGVTLRELREKAPEGWAALTAGMQHILQRALAVQPTDRYDSAAAFGRDCRALLSQWQTKDADTADELVESIELALDELKTGERNIAAALQDYQTKLDVLAALSQRGTLQLNYRNLKKVQLQLQAWLRGTPRWAEGWQMYTVAQYREAREIWQAEAPRIGSVSVWRWLMWVQYLIEDANTIKPDLRERAENFLQCMDDQHWDEALRIDLSGLRSTVLQMLQQEAEHQTRVESARREAGIGDVRRMQRAAADLRQAHSWLEVQQNKHPNYAQTLAATWGNLLEQAEALAQDAYESETQNQVLLRLSDSLRQDFDNGLRDLQQALRTAPATRIVVKFGLDQAERNPDKLSAAQVLRLLDAVQSHAYLSTAEQLRVKELQEQINRLQRERELKKVEGLRADLLRQIQTTLQQGALHNLPILAEALATVLDTKTLQLPEYRAFLKNLGKKFHEALTAGQIESAVLCCTTAKLLGEQVQEWEQNIVQRREQLQQAAEAAQREQQQAIETKQRQRQEAADVVQKVGELLNGLSGPERIELQKAYSGIVELQKTLAHPESVRERAVCQQALDYLNRLRNVFVPLAQYLTRELADLSSSVQKLGKRNQGEFPPLLLQRIERALMAQQQLNQAFYPNLDPELLVATPPLETFRSLQADCQRELPKILMRVDQALQAEWYRPESVAQMEKKPTRPQKSLTDWVIIGLFAIIIVVAVIIVIIFILTQSTQPGSVQITPTPTIPSLPPATPTHPALTPEGGLLPFAHLMANFLTFWDVF